MEYMIFFNVTVQVSLGINLYFTDSRKVFSSFRQNDQIIYVRDVHVTSLRCLDSRSEMKRNEYLGPEVVNILY